MEGRCKTCKWRKDYTSYHGHVYNQCTNEKFQDFVGPEEDELAYEFAEGGKFLVGLSFGCIHHMENDSK
jgi:hypothetical protein